MITGRQLIDRSDFWDSLLRSRGLTVNSRTVDPLTKVIALKAELVLGIDVYNMVVKVEETWAFPRGEVPPNSRPYLSVPAKSVRIPLAFALLALVASSVAIRKADWTEDRTALAVILLPVSFSASLALARERTGLAVRVSAPMRAAVMIALVILWVVASTVVLWR